MLPPTGSRCAELDARTSRHEGVIEQIGHRLTNLARGQRELSARIDSGFREINSRLFTALCWLIGIQITTLLTLGTLIRFKLGN